MMQLPCRSLRKLHARARRLTTPPVEEMKANHAERERCRDPRGSFRDRSRHDFPIAVAQIEFRCAWEEADEGKTAQVRALIRGKDQPVGRSASEGVRRAGPVIDRQTEGARRKGGEGQNANRAGTEVDLGP